MPRVWSRLGQEGVVRATLLLMFLLAGCKTYRGTDTGFQVVDDRNQDTGDVD